MTTATLLTVIALVASSGTDSARIDKGFADGLRVGDRGQVYYELSVGKTQRRVDVAEAEVLSVDAESALVGSDGSRELREGFRVEFEVASDRIAPAAILAIASQTAALAGREVDVQALQRLMPSDPETQELLLTWLEEQRARRLAEAHAEAAPRSVPTTVIPAGTYRIGPPQGKARYYNQQPAFDFSLSTLAIDRRPVSSAEFQAFEPAYQFSGSGDRAAGLVSYANASDYCAWRGARLPTEFEWEVAIQQHEVTAQPGQLEWTASWYAPYPGNTRPEAEYGERYRVLRGGLGGANGALDPHRRRFMDPASSSAEVGFRCARSAAD